MQHLKNEANSFPTINSLKQLADMTESRYEFLRHIIARQQPEPYKTFRIRKKSGGFRVIAIPDKHLLNVQQWIYRQILSRAQPSSVSYAFESGKSIRDAASVHCGCRWLIKLDFYNFFGSISEIDVYRVFRHLGYEPLIGFELARLCTRLGSLTTFQNQQRWHITDRYGVIKQYHEERMGHLPQGAPTSPALSNMVMLEFDRKVMSLAAKQRLTYSRYADDLNFSTLQKAFSREQAKAFIYEVYRVMRDHGHSPNMCKTTIIPPGARKIILGLLVDTEQPRLQKSVRNQIRQHIYYLKHAEVGPDQHAQRRGYDSTLGLQQYLNGLVSYVSDIDKALGEKYRRELSSVEWSHQHD